MNKQGPKKVIKGGVSRKESKEGRSKEKRETRRENNGRDEGMNGWDGSNKSE